MRYLFDKESNSLAITFAEGRQYRDSAEVADGIVVDFDTEGRPYSIEFLRADQFVDVEGLITGRPMRLAPHSSADILEIDSESLRRWREHLGLSQSELASRIRIPPEIVEAWESGARPIEHTGLLRLALQAIEGNAHEEYLRQALRDVTESLQQYLRNEPTPLEVATGSRPR
jgi:DNA-binding transcriptional regulator YiaG